MVNATDQLGRVLADRYRLVDLIGTGASSHVYAAEDAALSRRVAVKVLHPALASDQAFLHRFLVEAQSAAALNHPHVMRVFDWGESHGDGPFLVLEYLGGGSLREILDAGQIILPEQAASIGIQAGQALAYAHRHGIVHRDIKPANLLFDDEGSLRVADFGLARALAESAWTEPAGAILGTARYASPEQAEGRLVDDRSDVYSLTLVLFEALTGWVPFAADTTVATLMARLGANLPIVPQLGPIGPILADAARPDSWRRLDAQTLADRLQEAAREMRPPAPVHLIGPERRPASWRDPAVEDVLDVPPGPLGGGGGGGSGGTSQEAVPKTGSLSAPTETLPTVSPPERPKPPPPPRPRKSRRGASHDVPVPAAAVPAAAVPVSGSAGPHPAASAGPAGGGGAAAAGLAGAVTAGAATAGLGAAGWAAEQTRTHAPAPAGTPATRRRGDERPSKPRPGLFRREKAAPGNEKTEKRRGSGRRAAEAATLGAATGAGLSSGARSAAEAKPGRHRRTVGRRTAIGVAIACGVVIVVAIAALIGIDSYRNNNGLFGHVTPRFTGMTLSAARQRAAKLDLRIRVKADIYSSTVPPGKVMSQSIKPGTREQGGTAIVVVVSRGPRPVPIPNLSGDTAGQAINVLTRGHLAYREAPAQYSETIPAGDMISWSPTGRDVLPGTVVTFVTSKGPQPRIVPTIAGESWSQASSALQALRLTPVEQVSYSNTVPQGKVIDTSPAAGASVPRGSTVDVVVSKGPHLVRLPSNLIGLSVQAATSELQALGLVVAGTYGPGNTVITSYPIAGETVRVGTAVTLYTI
jgi:serine/threonine-protein kinase